MTTDSGKKPREFWILPQKGNDCDWTNLYPDESWKSGTKPLIHVREVTPCQNCERLERDLNHSAYLSDKRAFERDSSERINERVFKENDFLKKQIEMCRSNLIKISVRCEGGMHKQDFDRIAELTSECLAKLEKE